MKYERLSISALRLNNDIRAKSYYVNGVSICDLYNRLAELEDKIEKGTLIELPCKVGDTVFVIWQYSDFLGQEDKPFIEKDICKSFIYDENKMKIIPKNYAERNEYWYTVLDILLTREEAEKRLKELEKE